MWNHLLLSDILVETCIPLEDICEYAEDNVYGLEKNGIVEKNCEIGQNICNMMQVMLEAGENLEIKDKFKHYISKIKYLANRFGKNIKFNFYDLKTNKTEEILSKITSKIIINIYELNFSVEKTLTIRSALKKIISCVINMIFILNINIEMSEDVNELEKMLLQLNN